MSILRLPEYRKRFQFWNCVCCWAPSSEAAHYKGDFVGTGLEKPPDQQCAPLCTWCHRTGPIAQHRGNEKLWWKARGIDPLELGKRLHATWDADPKDAQGIYEIIGQTHEAIKQFANNAFAVDMLAFNDGPTLALMDVAIASHKVHLVSMGAAESYEQRVASLNAQMRATLEKLEAT